MEDFKARLWRLMQEKNLNNTTLGVLVGKSPTTVKYWREGTWPEMKTLSVIAEVFGVTEKYLLFGEEEEEPPQNVLREPEPVYGIPKEDLIEFYQWKANEATKQIERLKRIDVDANQ